MFLHATFQYCVTVGLPHDFVNLGPTIQFYFIVQTYAYVAYTPTFPNSKKI